MSIIRINTAELFVGHSPQVIETGGVGSCVVVCLYDPKNHIGGMAHLSLPGEEQAFAQPALVIGDSGVVGQEKKARYAVTGIRALLEEMKKNGAEKSEIVAKIVGGSEMFKSLSKREGIGKRITQSVRETLRLHKIEIDSQDIGGSIGRNVKFDLANGGVEITKKM